MIPIVKCLEIFCLYKPFTNAANYFIHGGVLIHADDMHLAMEMGGALTLMLSAAFQCQRTAKDTACRSHVPSVQILTAPLSLVTPRAVRTHSDTQEPGQAKADVQSMCFDYGKRISRCYNASNFVFGYV